jgi:hypothetical protein
VGRFGCLSGRWRAPSVTFAPPTPQKPACFFVNWLDLDLAWESFGHVFSYIGKDFNPTSRARRSESARRALDRRVGLRPPRDDDRRSRRAPYPSNRLFLGKPFGGRRPASARLPIQSSSSGLVTANVRPAESRQVKPSAMAKTLASDMPPSL